MLTAPRGTQPGPHIPTATMATGGWIPGEATMGGGGLLRSEVIPVGRILATPAKVLCSAVFISGRQLAEAMRTSAFIDDGICTLDIVDLVVVEVNTPGRSVSLTMALTEATVPVLIAKYIAKYPQLAQSGCWDAETQRLLALGSATRTAQFCGGSQGCQIMPEDGSGRHFTPTTIVTSLPPAATMGWPMGDRGVDSVGCGSGRAALAAECAFADPEMHAAAFLVLHRGKIVCEKYAAGITPSTQLESWSMGKSLTATLIGMLLHEGGHFELTDPAPIPAWQHDERSKIRVLDLLQMSSGLRFSGFDSPCESWDHGRPDHALPYSEAIDCFEWACSRPAEHPPGTVGRYRNCDPLALGYLVRKAAERKAVAAGESDTEAAYLSYPQRTLFDKLGIREQVLETDLWGNFISESSIGPCLPLPTTQPLVRGNDDASTASLPPPRCAPFIALCAGEDQFRSDPVRADRPRMHTGALACSVWI